MMKSKKLFWYDLANKKQAYFYPQNKSYTINFEYYNRRGRKRKKRKSIVGKYLSLGKWHFAISAKPILSPILAFNLKTHITFTDNGFQVWEDQKQRHTHRRKKGKTFFNEEWRDMLYAFIHGLKDEQNSIDLPLNENYTLFMPDHTEYFWASFGYWEPKGKIRQDILYDEYVNFEDNGENVEK